MNTLTAYINPLTSTIDYTENYEVIENEAVIGNNYNDLIISGSLFSLTLFKNVTFRACVFFGTRIENCQFINCEFIDCKFQFSNISYSDFHHATFKNCIWESTPVRKSLFANSDLDFKSSYFIKKYDNKFLSEEEEFMAEESCDHLAVAA
jgi:uncharacterized protein YjbI with pentapeptide repeats